MFERSLAIFHEIRSLHSNDEIAITIPNCNTLISDAKFIRQCKC